MLKTPRDKKIVAALARLQGDGDWITVLDWLKDSLASERGQNDKTLDEVTLRWVQGCAQTLNTIICASDESQDLHRKFINQ